MNDVQLPPWPKIPLREVASDFFSGGTPSTARPEYWTGDIEWTTSAQISGSSVAKGAKLISRLGLESSASSIVPKGNLLIGTRVGVGKAAVNAIDLAINQDLTAAIVRGDRYHPLFLAFALQTEEIQSEFESRKRGATIKGIPRDDLLSIEVPSPTLQEQKKIARVLRSIERLVEVQTTRVARLADLKTATMAKLFREGLRGEPLKESVIGPIPKSWEVVRLGELAKVGNGSTPNRSNEAYWHAGVFPWITSTKVHEVFIREASELVSEIALCECHLPVVPKGSLVIAITGQGKTLGNTALLEIDTCVNQHLAYVRFHNDRPVPEFFLFWLQNQYEFFRQVGSAGGSTKGALTCGFISNLPVPLPKQDEQRDIAALLLALTKRQQVAEKNARLVGDLFAAMLRQLMMGAVRVRDLDFAEVANA